MPQLSQKERNFPNATLAAALQPDQFRSDLPADLVQACEQTITTTTLAAARCLSGLAGAIQTLSALAG
jgi:hypothetical protein